MITAEPLFEHLAEGFPVGCGPTSPRSSDWLTASRSTSATPPERTAPASLRLHVFAGSGNPTWSGSSRPERGFDRVLPDPDVIPECTEAVTHPGHAVDLPEQGWNGCVTRVTAGRAAPGFP